LVAKDGNYQNEIPLLEDHTVQVFDENDVSLGAMTLAQAKEVALNQKKDAVLRSKNSNPPIIKIMEYRKDLMRKILTRLGNKKDETSDGKTKALQLSSNISSLDLENKKRQAISILKKSSVLKVYLKLS